MLPCQFESNPLKNQKAAVDSGQWILYRYNPDKIQQGENPLTLDSRPRRMKVEEYMGMENRFTMLMKSKPGLAKQYADQAQLLVRRHFALPNHSLPLRNLR